MCKVTPVAITSSMILIKRLSVAKMAESTMVSHNNEIAEILTFNGMPLPSR